MTHLSSNLDFRVVLCFKSNIFYAEHVGLGFSSMLIFTIKNKYKKYVLFKIFTCLSPKIMKTSECINIIQQNKERVVITYAIK